MYGLLLWATYVVYKRRTLKFGPQKKRGEKCVLPLEKHMRNTTHNNWELGWEQKGEI
jgi:hypothetical protein